MSGRPAPDGRPPDPVVAERSAGDAAPVRLVRSARRRKTAQARMVAGVLEVRVPAGLGAEEEGRLLEHFRAQFARRRRADGIDLASRAAALARTHGLPPPGEVRWVANQERRWASCTPASGSIRISDRATGFPPWVVDYLLVHELAHLEQANHSPAFWVLVNRYPLAERARGFLIAKGWDEPQE